MTAGAATPTTASFARPINQCQQNVHVTTGQRMQRNLFGRRSLKPDDPLQPAHLHRNENVATRLRILSVSCNRSFLEHCPSPVSAQLIEP